VRPRVLALLALLTLATPVAAAPRDEALRALGDAGNPEARRHALRTLAATGTMDDVPRIAQALRDPDRAVRTAAEAAMWEVWSRSGDAEIDRQFGDGVLHMSEGRWHDAVVVFSAIIARKPEFAEAWNKRATVYYLMGEYEKSLADCDEVVKRNPSHFGALSGYGQIYLKLDQPEKALDYFERALAVNPNMEQVQAVIEQLRALVREKRKRSI
jgi:tetratricopeptide (TPR) repeat protein